MAEDGLCVLAPLRIEALAVRRGACDACVHRTGKGPRRARLVAAGLVARLQPGQPVAVLGVCGGLADGVRVGDVIVADRVRSADGDVDVSLPGAALLAAELAAGGLTVRVGPIVSTDRITTGGARRALAQHGALAVDMESAWLVAAAGTGEAAHPVAVVRVVVDTAQAELRSFHVARNASVALRRLAATVPALERWARATGPWRVLLAGPRSFCAGVDRAIEIVERAIERYEPPVYVRRQIVHNSHVVGDLERKGAVFVQEVDEVPDGSTLVLAAHGVALAVRLEAAARDVRVIDATCPLVAKVHTEVRRFADNDFDIVLIGHADHEEVEGTLGEAPSRISVIGPADDIDGLHVRDPDRVAYVTQTTLAVDEVESLVVELRERFPRLAGPRREDICYATQNRQQAIAAIAPEADLVLVVGSANSSNSHRLAEVAGRAGTASHLVDGPADISLEWLEAATTVAITAGASAPESKVREVLSALGSLGVVTVEERQVQEESVSFGLPAEVR